MERVFHNSTAWNMHFAELRQERKNFLPLLSFNVFLSFFPLGIYCRFHIQRIFDVSWYAWGAFLQVWTDSRTFGKPFDRFTNAFM